MDIATTKSIDEMNETNHPLSNANAGSVPHLDSRILQGSCLSSVGEQSQCVHSEDEQGFFLVGFTVNGKGADFERAFQDFGNMFLYFDAVATSDSSSLQPVPQHLPLNNSSGLSRKYWECPLCFIRQPLTNFPRLSCCSHRSCKSCLVQYLQVEIMESRVQLTCPECSELLHPTDIYYLMSHCPDLIKKYETFALRRVLMMDPDTRWCPAPDCTYAVIATSCAACPELRCERPGCGALFCYHCKGPWHASQTCDEARKERGEIYRRSVPQLSTQESTLKRGDIKACPRCRTYIVKMNDGSCNHMVCAMCSAQFCWLCLREINDLHYLSPTGCTFWGKKPWTRKKKLLCQIGTLIGAPVGIALIAGLAIPGIIFGVPVFVGRKVNQRFAHLTRIRRRCLTAGSVIGSLVVSPVLAVMAVGVGVPIMLAYVYGVVPLSLCRNGGCGVGSGSSKPDQDNLDDDEIWHEMNIRSHEKSPLLNDMERQDGTSVITRMSVNSGLSSAQQIPSRLQVQAELCRRRPSVESGINSLGEKFNYEEASTKAMAGSQYNDDKSVQTVCSGQEAVSYCEEVASIVALAGSVVDAKSLTDSASGRVFLTQMYCRDRDLSPSSQHAIACSDLSKADSERPCESQQNTRQEIIPHTREDSLSCGGACKRRGRATSIVSAASGGVTSHRLMHTCSNLRCGFITENAQGDGSDELVLMADESVPQLSDLSKGLKQSSSGSIKVHQIMRSSHSNDSSDAKADRFHIRALFDTMKRIVSDDVVAESEKELEVQQIRNFNFRSVLRHPAQKDAITSNSGLHLGREKKINFVAPKTILLLVVNFPNSPVIYIATLVRVRAVLISACYPRVQSIPLQQTVLSRVTAVKKRLIEGISGDSFLISLSDVKSEIVRRRYFYERLHVGMADDLKLDLTGKKKKSKKPIVLDDEVPKTDENVAPSLESEELILGPKKKKKVPKVPVVDEERVPEEASDVVAGAGLSNLIDSQGAWPDYTYEQLLELVFGIMRERNPELAAGEKKKFVMKPPQVARAGSKKTAFANFAEICRLLKRQPKHVLQFLLAELGTTGSIDGNSCLIVKGRFQQKHIESVLRKYIKEYVTCHTCRSSETELTKDTRLFFLECKTCGSRCSVTAIKSGFTAMVGKRAALRRAAEATAGLTTAMTILRARLRSSYLPSVGLVSVYNPLLLACRLLDRHLVL
uniref:Eukaryotic translation initiation factor 2 subunit 2 n=1 Tax=Setaria digitata TaxID=48799 RepID=A0A915PI64_9BILA